jgi:predicted HAD superfamily phosphohydrolase YqeG
MIITDMLVANLMDADSILVRPIIDPEKAWTKILNWFEQKVFKRLDKKNLLTHTVKLERGIYGTDYEEL